MKRKNHFMFHLSIYGKIGKSYKKASIKKCRAAKENKKNFDGCKIGFLAYIELKNCRVK